MVPNDHSSVPPYSLVPRIQIHRLTAQQPENSIRNERLASMTSDPTEQPNVRLHISPIDPESLSIILGHSQGGAARPLVSYHRVQSDPDKCYGFVTLPADQAASSRSKFDGKIFRGAKMSVSVAREGKLEKFRQSLARVSEDTGNAVKSRSTTRDPARKEGEVQGLIKGVELVDRRVMRGWSKTAREKQPTKMAKIAGKRGDTRGSSGVSQTSVEPRGDCLFKQKVPGGNGPASLEGNEDTEAGVSSSGKKRKRAYAHEAKTVTVKEFEKRTKFPTFLKSRAPSGQGNVAFEYDEERGWLDEAGEVVEGAKPSGRPKRHRPREQDQVVTKPDNSPVQNEASSPQNADSEVSTHAIDGAAELEGVVPIVPPSEILPGSQDTGQGLPAHKAARASSRSASPVQPDPNSIVPSIEPASAPPNQTTHLLTSENPRKQRHRTRASDASTQAPPEGLETPASFFAATFKRPSQSNPKKLGIKTQASDPPGDDKGGGFRFFDPELSEDDQELSRRSASLSLNVPQTPGTRWRRQRSTAPTPDTAAIGGWGSRLPWAPSQDDDDEDRDDDDDDDDDGDDDDDERRGDDEQNRRSSTPRKPWGAGASISTSKKLNTPASESSRHYTRSQDRSKSRRKSDHLSASGASKSAFGSLSAENGKKRDFKEVFYEVRKESDRAWRTARKEAMKEQRRREERNWEGRVGIRRSGGRGRGGGAASTSTGADEDGTGD